jgi:hypothetical protein
VTSPSDTRSTAFFIGRGSNFHRFPRRIRFNPHGCLGKPSKLIDL